MKNIKVKWPLNPQETVLFKVNAVHLQSTWKAKQGAIYITSERIVFEIKPMMMFFLFGIIGWLLTKNKKSYEIPLTDITDFKRGKQGFNKKVAEFDLLDGSKSRFGITGKWEAFDMAYQKAMLDVKPLFSIK